MRRERSSTNRRRPTPRGDDSLVPLIDTLAELAAVAAGHTTTLGVGVPGLVNRDGVLQAAPNLDGVAHFDVAGLLRDASRHHGARRRRQRRHVRRPWPNGRLGAGIGTTDMVLVTLGTGIGGGLVVNGEVVRGRNGFAGEYGHMVVDPTVRPARAGDAAAGSATRPVPGWRCSPGKRRSPRRCQAVVELAGGDPQAVRGEHVQVAARAGDAEALAVIDEFGRWVALGLSNLTNALDPQMFVLGGGLASGADLYLEPIVGVVRRAALPAAPATDPAVEFARGAPRRRGRRRPRSPPLSTPLDPRSRQNKLSAGRPTSRITSVSVVAGRRLGPCGSPRQASSRPPRPCGRGVLVGLERLVDVEEVLDLLDAAAA